MSHCRLLYSLVGSAWHTDQTDIVYLLKGSEPGLILVETDGSEIIIGTMCQVCFAPTTAGRFAGGICTLGTVGSRTFTTDELTSRAK